MWKIFRTYVGRMWNVCETYVRRMWNVFVQYLGWFLSDPILFPDF